MQSRVTVLLVRLLSVWFPPPECRRRELISVWSALDNDPHLLIISSSLHTITTPLWSSVPAGSSLCTCWSSRSWVSSLGSSDKYKTERLLDAGWTQVLTLSDSSGFGQKYAAPSGTPVCFTAVHLSCGALISTGWCCPQPSAAVL